MIHDAVHGSFYLHKLLWQIIDTPEFQRLRQIKQCGNTHYIYDCANHTRFEHSIGVAHLCDIFTSKLLTGDESSILNPKIVLCIQIAGLCHDIGHCAFSHLFDNEVVPYFHPGTEFCHEQASYMILLRIYHRLAESFNSYQIFQDDIKFIGKLILGSPRKVPSALQDELIWNEFDRQNQFLFQIVSDETDGIDVDKFDYIKRDCHNTGIVTGFNPQRLMEFAFIFRDKESGIRKLVYLDKAVELISEMWKSRSDLHRRVYQHRVVKCVDEMVLEIFKLAGKKFLIDGIPLSEIHLHMDAYLKVTDHILTLIKYSPLEDPETTTAKQLIGQLESRNLWKTVCSIHSKEPLDLEWLKSGLVVSTTRVADDWIYYLFQKTEVKPDLSKLLSSLPSNVTVKLKY